MNTCELCKREVNIVTEHHLIPKSRHLNKRVKRNYTTEQLNQTVNLCKPCHGHIHSVLTEKEMERDFNTIDKLLSYPEILKFVKWVKNKSPSFQTVHKDAKVKQEIK